MTIQVKSKTIDECIMANQGKMERNSKICKFKTMKSTHDMHF